jgi:Holliday junction resolvase
MNAKAKGSRNERKTIRLLEAAGYVCMKAGASLGIFDVIGIGSQDFVLVQCKTNSWGSGAEQETIKLFRAPANARKLLHRWDDYARLPKVREL